MFYHFGREHVDIVLDSAPGRVFNGTVSSVGFAVSHESGGAVGDLESVDSNAGWLRDAQRFPVYISFDDDLVISQSQSKDVDNSFVIPFLDAEGKVANFQISEHQIISGKLKKQFPNHRSYDIQKVNDAKTFGKMIVSPSGVYVIYHSPNGTVLIVPTENDGIYKIEKDWERTHRHGIECSVDHSKLEPQPNYNQTDRY